MPQKKDARKRTKKPGKIADLPAKSLKGKDAAKVKGGTGGWGVPPLILQPNQQLNQQLNTQQLNQQLTNPQLINTTAELFLAACGIAGIRAREGF